MGLVGRDPELEAATRAVRDARAGGRRVLAVVGEAGIGKTALLAEIARRAERSDMLVLRARGVEHARAVPYATVMDAFDGTPAELEPAGTGPVERFRCNRERRALLERLGRERPVALVPCSTTCSRPTRHRSSSSTTCCAGRPRRRTCSRSRRATPARCRGCSTRRAAPRASSGLALVPLAHDAALDLLADVADPAVRERVAREAAGNPLFLGERAARACRATTCRGR